MTSHICLPRVAAGCQICLRSGQSVLLLYKLTVLYTVAHLCLCFATSCCLRFCTRVLSVSAFQNFRSAAHSCLQKRSWQVPVTYVCLHQHHTPSLQVLAQRIRWSEGYQAPTNSQPAVGMAEANTSRGSTPAAATTVSELLDYRDPKAGLTPLMAAVVKGYLAVTRQVWPGHHNWCMFARF